jgi:transcription termination factor Rho
VTDTTEQATQTLLTVDGAPESGATGARSTATTRRKGSGSLSTMLVPELQQLAGSLGINTSKMRKSDLVAAIQTARGGATSSPATSSATRTATGSAASSARTSTAPAADAATKSAAPAATGDENGNADSAPTTGARRSRRGAFRPAGQPETDSNGNRNDGPAEVEQPAAARMSGAGNSENNGSSTTVARGEGSRTSTTNDRGGSSNSSSNGSATNNNGSANGGSNNRASSERGSNDRGSNERGSNERGSNDNNSSRTNGRGDNRQTQQSPQSGQNGQSNRDDDDDFEGGRRRGRRYRDRRGRNRDRNGNDRGVVSGGGGEAEPTVTEDDVLVPVAGILDEIPDKNTWFVRTAGYFASPDDVYVANSYIRRYNLRRGDAVTGAIKQIRDGERREKYNPLVRLDTVNGREPDASKSRVEFTKLTPLYPQERLRLETEPHILTTRVIDLVMPIGKGQRALIVSPPKAGKTMVLQAIANAIATNNPEVHLMVVLVDERPEEVTDMQRSVKGEVIASTFDRRPGDHTTVAELSIERAKRLVEMGHDVVVLLDSITRLGRAYNLSAPASGRILSGGVDSTALYQPKRFLGAARNIENGGSLTIIATALVETGSAGDTVFFEEYKGTGNAELKLDRKIADKRVFPAVDVDQSSTRKEEILLSPDELAVTIKLRRVLHALESQQAIDLLTDRLRKTRTNIEFLMQIAKTTPGQD